MLGKKEGKKPTSCVSCSHSPEALSRCGAISVELNKQVVSHGPQNIPWVFIACVPSQQRGRQSRAIEHFHIVVVFSIFKIEGCEVELKEMDSTYCNDLAVYEASQTTGMPQRKSLLARVHVSHPYTL